MTKFTIAVLALVASLTSASAQTPEAAAAHTPGECLEAVDKYTYKVYQEAQAAGTANDMDAIKAAQSRFAGECAKKFDVSSIDPRELAPLTFLFAVAHDSVKADAASSRMAAMAATPDARALAQVVIAMSFQGSPRSERAIAALDSMPDEVIWRKFGAHAQLLSHYRHEDMDARILPHAYALTALGPRLPEHPKEANDALIGAYKALAEVWGDYGRADSSIAIVERGLRDLSYASDAAERLKPIRERYAMVGTQAPAIEATRWLNAPDTTRRVPLSGKVSLVQFTATWCPPCRKSYPAMQAIHKRYAGPNFQLLFTTDVYGQFEGKKMAPADEIAADRAYYVTTHAMAFPIGIYQARTDSSGKQTEDPNAERYRLTDIPQVVVVDRRGTIRRILVGWDEGHEARLTTLVGELLAEK
jgi:thiol-disulfide isomerase/thioredoxin